MSAQAYVAEVDALVRQALTSGVDTFEEMLWRLPGVFPSDVRDSTARLGVTLRFGHTKWSVPDVREPIPHGLDADWRFNRQTREWLTERVYQSRSPRLVLMGCPSLCESVVGAMPSRQITLAEVNERWIASGLVSAAGISCVGPVEALNGAGHPELAILDPPWYVPETLRFLRAASRACSEGAQVLLSFPAAATRPGVAEELVQIEESAREWGLAELSIERRALRYATPWFEVQALRALGFPPLGDWRTGDLITFERTAAEPSPPELPQHPSNHWTSAEFGFLQLRIREAPSPDAPIDTRLRPLTEGDILPSVSRRHPLRERIRVWTSGHRVFDCTHTASLRAALDAAARGDDPEQALAREAGRSLRGDERRSLSVALQQFADLERLERQEYNQWRDINTADS